MQYPGGMRLLAFPLPRWLLALLLLLVGLVGSAGPAPAPAAAGEGIAVYFTAPRYPDDPARHRGGLDARLVEFIRAARTSLDVAAHDLDLIGVARALVAAQQRGARVRVVVESDNGDEPAVARLRAAGIPVVQDGRSGLMHHKFVVADGARVWTGSWNFTENDTYLHNNQAAILSSRALAASFTAEFEKMFLGHRFGPIKPPGVPFPVTRIGGDRVEVLFAPTDDIIGRLRARIAVTRRRLDFVAFSFTHDLLGEAILRQARAGVRVRGVFDRRSAGSGYSEYHRLRRAGLAVRKDGNPGLMHSKFFIFDERAVAFGSFNPSVSGAEQNDENLVIVEDTDLARRFGAEFQRVWSRAGDPLPPLPGY